jgi:hypothetical protein
MNTFIPGNRLPLLCLWVAFIVTFAVTRTITARIRGGSTGLRNWNIGGVHVHHQVFGIMMMLIAGSLEFAYAPQGFFADALGALFGVGAALTLDEFALWLRLDDVYWSKEGRVSVDAVVIAVAVTGLVLTGLTPLNITDVGQGFRWEASAAALLNLGFVVVTMAKGKPVAGAVGIMIPFIALVAAVRLAKPTSPWARGRYDDGSKKLARARARFGPAYDARWNRLRDLVGRMTAAQR